MCGICTQYIYDTNCKVDMMWVKKEKLIAVSLTIFVLAGSFFFISPSV